MRKSIKKVAAPQGIKIKYQDPPNYDKKPPIFSLEKLQQGNYCFSKLDDGHKAKFADAIFRRKNLTWEAIKQNDRHGLGTEKIPKDKIKATIPKFITDEIKDFLVFRYNGRHPMVGYRQRDIFFVLWFDHDFTLYPHS